jgi:hypothetical protein
MSRATDLAWAAGFFDGEGCACSAKCRKGHQINLQLAQKEKALLLKFQMITGCGYIFKRAQDPKRFRNYKSLKATYIHVWRIGDLAIIEKIYK